ncbi:hypothetical protein FA95DRAFT_1201601 [Auriscalpium vulgare]|uniref:Uncharacterized protein n=1 Tax=Auriscalpium vulgare TaxID=40419 RepID=A0ACB8R3F4_9AGAM|nr:hypothetical protein FA95DRAFT_1201601 [Auriscalpium vulgare]
MDAPIFQEGPDHRMRFLGERREGRFSSAIHFVPPTSGTTRRLLFLKYNCYVFMKEPEFNSIWTGCEPVGVELHPVKISGVLSTHTYWLDCSVASSQQCATSSAFAGLDEQEPQELKYECTVEVDPISFSHHIQLRQVDQSMR